MARDTVARQTRAGLRTDGVPLLLVALLVLVAAFTSAVGPGLLDRLADRALRQNIAAAALPDRSVSLDLTAKGTTDPGDALAEVEKAFPQKMPQELSAALGPGGHSYEIFETQADGATIAKPGGIPDSLTIAADSRADHLLTYIRGVPPSKATDIAPSTIPVALSEQASTALNLPLGAVFTLGSPTPKQDGSSTTPARATVVGIYRRTPATAITPDDALFFAQSPYLLQAAMRRDAVGSPAYWVDEGVTSDQGILTAMGADAQMPGVLRWWRTIDPATVTAPKAAALMPVLARYLREGLDSLCHPDKKSQDVDCGTLIADSVREKSLTTGLPDLVAVFEARRLGARAVESFAIAGVLAVELAAVLAAARFLALRSAAPVALQRVRGASRRQIVAILGLETAAVVIPATVVGWLLGGATGTLWVPAVIGGFGLVVIPATVLRRAAPGSLTARGTQARMPKARRRTLEGLLVVLAVAGVLSVRGRGIAGTVVGGIDPTIAAVPVLVAAVVAALLIKALPRPALAAARLLGRGRSTTGWLGLARAAERGQALVTATVVLVLALSGAVFGGVVTRTLNAGEADSAARYGTDALIAGVPFTTGSMTRLRALPGVTLHEVTTFDRAVTDTDGSQSQVRFLDVERGLLPGVPATRTPQGYYPVLATAQAVKEHPGGVFTVAFLHQTITVQIVGHAPTELPGVLRAATNDSQYSAVLMDRALYTQASGSLAPSAVGLDGAVSTAQIESALVGLPTPGLLWVRSEHLASMRADGLARSLSGVFEACGLLSAAFAILVIVLELAGTARERGKTVSFLRTMGLAPRGAAVVTAVQLIPTAVATALGGALLGAALPWLLGPALDLGSFTEGFNPAVRVDWRITAALAGGLLAVVVAAAAVEAAVSRGRRLAGVLRLGDGE